MKDSFSSNKHSASFLMQEKFLALFSEQKIARKGHFQLESGYHGDLLLDLDALFLKPACIRPFVQELASRFAEHKIEAICGPFTGGAIVAEMIASTLDIEFYPAERFDNSQGGNLFYSVEYRIPGTLRKKAKGKTFALVDDVINAGSAVRSTFQDILSCGATPVIVGALLVLGSKASEYFADKNVSLEKVAYLENNLWMPSQCPLCASHIPLDDPALLIG